MTNFDRILKRRDINLPTKIQSHGFYSCHVQMWELDSKKGSTLKNWCLWTVVLEKTLESPLDCKEIKPVNHKGNNTEYSLKVLMLKLKLQYSDHLLGRADSLEKTLMLGKIEGRRRNGKQRMRWLNGIADSMDEFEQALGAGKGQGSLVCCSPWVSKCWNYNNCFLKCCLGLS